MADKPHVHQFTVSSYVTKGKLGDPDHTDGWYEHCACGASQPMK